MKILSKYSITQIISAFSIALVLLLTITNLSRIDSHIKLGLENQNASHNKDISNINANLISQLIKNKTILIEVNNSNLKRIKSKEDAELFLEKWLKSSTSFFEYSKYKKTNDRNLKRDFTLFNQKFFKNTKTKNDFVFKKDAPGLLEFLTNLSNKRLQYKFLTDNNNNLRLLILYHQPNSNEFHLFKFALHLSFHDHAIIKDSSNNIVFPFHQKNQISKDLNKKDFVEINQTEYQIASTTKGKSPPTSSKIKRSLLLLALIFSVLVLVLVYFVFLPFELEKKQITKDVKDGNFHLLERPLLDRNLAPLLDVIVRRLNQDEAQIENQSKNISNLTQSNLKISHQNKEFSQIIHMMFSSLELGFFTFNREGQITDLHNKYFQDMLTRPVSSVRLEDLFGSESEIWLRNIFQGTITIEELNLLSNIEPVPEILATRDKYQPKFYSLLDPNHDQIICVLENISESESLSEQINSSDEILESIATINNDKNFFQDFLRTLEISQKDIQIYSTEFQKDRDFFAIIKTRLKSFLLYLDYFHLKQATSLLDNFLTDKSNYSRDQYLQNINILFEDLFLSINLLAPFTGIAPFQKEDQIFHIYKTDTNTDMFEISASLYIENIEFIFRNLIEAEGKICHEFKLIDEVGKFNFSKIKKFMSLLIEVYTNIAIHGALPPDARNAEGKNDGISVLTKIFIQNERIVFVIDDDGAGINPSDIKAFLNSMEADHYTLNKNDQDIIQEIFKDRITTNPKTNSGYGLSLLRREVNILNGRYYVESRHGIGTTITLEVPII